jgi:hypothetical protein
MPLAAAATIGAIAIGILQIANPDKVIEPAHDKAIVSDMPSSSSQTAPTAVPPSPPASDDTRNRFASTPPEAPPALAPAPAPPTAPVPAPKAAPAQKAAPALRKDTASKFASEDQASKPEALAPRTPSGGGREAGAVDSAKPAAPIAEPFPADAKREAKQNAAASSPPPASIPAGPPASGLAGKLSSAPEPSARDEITREAQRENTPMAQSAAPAARAPMRRSQETESARATAQKNEAADAAPAARAKVQPKLAVPDWIALIRKLREEGKMDEAAKELTAFRAAYPDHERLLPPDLRDWKPVVE